jgi:2-phospho-L-lactate guanylyltransferase
LVPVRQRDGKSRLGAGVARAALTRAMVTDVVAAARACSLVRAVVVVVGSQADVAWLEDAWDGSDPTLAPWRFVVGGRGLNEDLERAAADCASDDPVVVVMADLAGITTTGLAAVLRRAAGARSVVADASGTGTALLLSPRGAELAPRFGPQSYARHRQGGAADLTASADPAVRLDVDTPDDLAALVQGHVVAGPATLALLSRDGHGLAPGTATSAQEEGH